MNYHNHQPIFATKDGNVGIWGGFTNHDIARNYTSPTLSVCFRFFLLGRYFLRLKGSIDYGVSSSFVDSYDMNAYGFSIAS